MRKTERFAGFFLLAGILFCGNLPLFAQNNKSMVHVEGGTFVMGKNSGSDYETPEHKVTLSSFYICDHEVTQAEYMSVTGKNPSKNKGSSKPVEKITWYDAVAYCNWLSRKEGLTPCYSYYGEKDASKWGDAYTNYYAVNYDYNSIRCDFSANGYRLPTEAEWEYASRGGNKSKGFSYSGSNNLGEVAWFAGNSGLKTHEVKTKKQNELGLYDMTGNVSEWCWDWLSIYPSEDLVNPQGWNDGFYFMAEYINKTLRGGAYSFPETYKDDLEYCSNRKRNYYTPLKGFDTYGFRVARTDTSAGPVKVSASANANTSSKNAGQTSVKTGAKTAASKKNSGSLFDCLFNKKTSKTSASKSSSSSKTNSSSKSNSSPKTGAALDDGFVFVEGGTFIMGNNRGEDNEKPEHSVTLSSFYMCDHELTQKEFKEIMHVVPDTFPGDRRPAELNWYMAVLYCNLLSEKNGLTPCYSFNGKTNVREWERMKKKEAMATQTSWDAIKCDFSANGYRMPTEAEWEYAARGGKKSKGYRYAGSDNLDEVAWYADNTLVKVKVQGYETYQNETQEVKRKKPNELGLYDMTGNVCEWCWDWFGSYENKAVTNPHGIDSDKEYMRILRGGGYHNGIANTKSLENRDVNKTRWLSYPKGWQYEINIGYGVRIVRSAE